MKGIAFHTGIPIFPKNYNLNFNSFDLNKIKKIKLKEIFKVCYILFRNILANDIRSLLFWRTRGGWNY